MAPACFHWAKSLCRQRCLHRYWRIDPFVGMILAHLEVIDLITVDVRRLAPELKFRERQRLPRKLLPRLFEMVQVEVRVAAHPKQFATFHIDLLGHHRKQGRLLADVEWCPKKEIA